jgi:NAD(P)-dependent dehydrogenase (short-subunit alcohol dehydrogenase family)
MGVVLITGCSSGFGLELALAFARHGDATYASMRNLAKADPLLERARSEDLAVELLELDVDDDDSVAAAVRRVEDRHGAIDILINNAGVDYTGAVETIDLDKARAVMETNFWGPVRTIRAALPAMRAKGGAGR